MGQVLVSGGPTGDAEGFAGRKIVFLTEARGQSSCSLRDLGEHAFEILCRAVETLGDGSQVIADQLSPSVSSLSWDPPELVSGIEPERTTCETLDNLLTFRCEVSFGWARDLPLPKTDLELAIKINSSRKPNSIAVNFSAFTAGWVPQMESYQAPQLNLANPERPVPLGFQPRGFPKLGSYVGEFSGVCQRSGEDAYYVSADRFIYRVIRGQQEAVLWAGSATKANVGNTVDRNSIAFASTLIDCHPTGLFVWDYSNARVVRLTETGPAVVIASHPDLLADIYRESVDFAVTPDETVYLVKSSRQFMMKIQNGVLTRVSLEPAGETPPVRMNPSGVALGKDSSVFVVGGVPSYGGSGLRKIDSTGKVSVLLKPALQPGPGVSADFPTPRSLVFLDANRLLLPNQDQLGITQITLNPLSVQNYAGKVGGDLAGEGVHMSEVSMTDIVKISVMPDSSLFYVSASIRNPSQVKSISANGIVTTFMGMRRGEPFTPKVTSTDPNRSMLLAATHISFGADGSLYMAMPQDYMKVLDPTGKILTTSGIRGLYRVDYSEGQLNAPIRRGTKSWEIHPLGDVAYGKNGDVFIFMPIPADRKILRVDTQGNETVLMNQSSAVFNADGSVSSLPWGTMKHLLVADDGTLLVSDDVNHRILSIGKMDGTGRIETVAGTGVGGFSGDGGDATAAKLNSPTDLALLPDGTVLVADRLNGRVRTLTRSPTSSGYRIDTLFGGPTGGRCTGTIHQEVPLSSAQNTAEFLRTSASELCFANPTALATRYSCSNGKGDYLIAVFQELSSGAWVSGTSFGNAVILRLPCPPRS